MADTNVAIRMSESVDSPSSDSLPANEKAYPINETAHDGSKYILGTVERDSYHQPFSNMPMWLRDVETGNDDEGSCATFLLVLLILYIR